MPGSLETDELGNVFEVLSEDELIAFGHHRHITHTVFEETLAPLRVIEHVDGDEFDLFARKKLFRPETATSSGLREQDEGIKRGIHGRAIP